MSIESQAAEEITRITINGISAAAKVGEEAVERTISLISSILKREGNAQSDFKAQEKLRGMLSSGREMAVFSIKDMDLYQFVNAARANGIKYILMKDRTHPNGQIEVVVYKDEMSKIQRMFEDVKIELIDRGKIYQELCLERDGISLSLKDSYMTVFEKDDSNPFAKEALKSRQCFEKSTIYLRDRNSLKKKSVLLHLQELGKNKPEGIEIKYSTKDIRRTKVKGITADGTIIKEMENNEEKAR